MPTDADKQAGPATLEGRADVEMDVLGPDGLGDHQAQRAQQAQKGTQKARRNIELEAGRILPGTDPKGKTVRYRGNHIQTARYNNWNMLPKSLWEQITRPTNLFFILVCGLQSIEPISVTQGIPTAAVSTVAVIVIGILKALLEDVRRRQEDTEENGRPSKVLLTKSNEWRDLASHGLVVGDLIKLVDNQVCPADLLLLHSSLPDGYCYVETANLDGETNLKIKTVPENTKNQLDSPSLLSALALALSCDPPSGTLDRWSALLQHGGKEAVATADSLLLRGCKLKNTRYVYGLVVYTGEDSKIRMNSSEGKQNKRVKQSSTERLMNKLVLGLLAVLLLVSSGLAVANHFFESGHQHHFYLVKRVGDGEGFQAQDYTTVEALLKVLTWFLALYQLVPISLVFSLEVGKFAQGKFMEWDVGMATVMAAGDSGPATLAFARTQTSALNEELAQVQIILSDKTGTLTCNSMDFRKAIIGGTQYGSGDTDISLAAQQRPSFVRTFLEPAGEEDAFVSTRVNFNARAALQRALFSAPASSPERRQAERFMLTLALGNTVFPTKTKKGGLDLKASSPDEECLVHFAKAMGYTLAARNPPLATLELGRPEKSAAHSQRASYIQLACLDFTSKRKRMSTIIRMPDGSVSVLSKGADAFIQPLLKGHGTDAFAALHPHWDFTMTSLEGFGEQGLRTLLVAVAEREASWWDHPVTGWKKRYEDRMKALLVETEAEAGHFKGGCRDDCGRCALEEEIERDSGLLLVGATAIEDKLQDGVPATIRDFLAAGVQVWVLTGDKMETAVNISLACNLLEGGMSSGDRLLYLDGADLDAVRAQLDKHTKKIQSYSGGLPLGLVLASHSYAVLEEAQDPALDALFMGVADACKSVVGCRMQPNQKASVVAMVKRLTGKVTLAIGDGANDEQMIREAHVGVGIRGVEGTAAVRAADFAIGQFRFLRRLCLVWGRTHYQRISILILYLLYKNALHVMSSLWMGFYSGFSGQMLVFESSNQLYNTFLTSLPVLFFVTMDRQEEPAYLLAHPALYKQTNRGQLFGPSTFLRWMLKAVVQSTIIFFTVTSVYDSTGDDPSGRVVGHWWQGMVVFNLTVLVATAQLCLYFTSWTVYHVLPVVVSIGMLYATSITFSRGGYAIAAGDITFSYYHFLATPSYWVTVVVVLVCCLLVDHVEQVLLAFRVCPCRRSEAASLQTFENLQKNSVPDVQPPAGFKPGARRHTGFAFEFTENEGRRATGATGAASAGPAKPTREESKSEQKAV